MFIGPRVRMGVHWAEAGIVVKDHEHTKHKHFEGPSYEMAVAVGDAASGGQIVMTKVSLTQSSLSAAVEIEFLTWGHAAITAPACYHSPRSL